MKIRHVVIYICYDTLDLQATRENVCTSADTSGRLCVKSSYLFIFLLIDICHAKEIHVRRAFLKSSYYNISIQEFRTTDIFNIIIYRYNIEENTNVL